MQASASPLVSVVTPSYNMAPYLPETIESVLGQDYPKIEYIVVDGGSKDATLEILERYGDRISYTSGPDAGPADAILKGFRRATGDILAWLNADDTLLPGAIRTAVDHLERHPEVDVVYGEGWWTDENGAVINRYPTLDFDAPLLERECFLCQPATFMRSRAYRGIEIDPTVTCAFDYDLWIRMAKAGRRFAFLPQYLANSRIHRGCLTIRERDSVFRSSMDVLRRHYGYIPLAWIFGYTSFQSDRRDQFFEPLRPSLRNYVASLPVGLRMNREKPLRFAREWASKPFETAFRRLTHALHH